MNSNGTPKNLRPPWRKGEPSPNPSGRPRRLPISDTYALLVAEPIPEYLRRALKRKGIYLEPGATFADALGLQMLVRAINGDPKAAREIRESIEGKAGQRPTDPINKDVNVRVIYESKDVPPEPGPQGGAIPSSDKDPEK